MSPKAEEEQVATVEATPIVDASPIKDAQSEAGTEVSAEDPVELELQNQAGYCFDFSTLCCGIGNKGICPECQQGVAYSDNEAVAVGVEETKYYHSWCYEERERLVQAELQKERIVAIQAVARGKLARTQLAAQKEEEEPAKDEAEGVAPETEADKVETQSQASEEQAKAEEQAQAEAEEEEAMPEEANVEEDVKIEEETSANVAEEAQNKVEEDAPVAEKSVEDDVDAFPPAPSNSVEEGADEDGSVEIQAVDDDGSVEIKEAKSAESEKKEDADAKSEDKSSDEKYLAVNTDNSVESAPVVEQVNEPTQEEPASQKTTALAKPQKKSFVAKLRKAFGCKAADTHVVTN